MHRRTGRNWIYTTMERLSSLLSRLDGKGYKAYKDTLGTYTFPDFALDIDKVQADPFAPPTRIRVRVPAEVAGFPEELWDERDRRIGTEHALAKALAAVAEEMRDGKDSAFDVMAPGQEILESTTVRIRDGDLEARLRVHLPARGRKIMGRKARYRLTKALPELVERSLRYSAHDPEGLAAYGQAREDWEAIRRELPAHDLVAFVAEGSVLPRASGIDDRPLQEGAVPFATPDELAVELETPNRGTVKGMGIPKGVTLIVGGGFHGKSSLLQAIERGIYAHVPGDGRELVVTTTSAMKIRAEDGRSVTGVDISPLIDGLPGDVTTTAFTTMNASGSTSQAAAIIEALEAGSRLLLMDEDTTATNLMIRDARMQQLISDEQEPITPVVHTIRSLAEGGISAIIVMGGSGDYFGVADQVIAMDHFVPRIVTEEAKALAKDLNLPEVEFGAWNHRSIDPACLDPRKGKWGEHVKARGRDIILYGTETIDLGAMEQLVHPGQTKAMAKALRLLYDIAQEEPGLLKAQLDAVMDRIHVGGLEVLTSTPRGEMAEFRLQELAAALNRYRKLRTLDEPDDDDDSWMPGDTPGLGA